MRYADGAPLPAIELAHGLRGSMRAGYRAADLRADAVAGLTVGVVALPLSMALAIATGVPPQHGLYTAIVAGVAVALLGGSRFQVTGPTAAFIALLAPIVQQHGLGGLLVAGMLSGAIQIAMGAARMGRLMEYVPHPVTTGFTFGIAVVIASIQLKDLLGVDIGASPEFIDRLAACWNARGSVSGWETLIAAVTLAMLVSLPRVDRRVPAPLVALIVAAALAALLHATVAGFDVATIGSRFRYEYAGGAGGGIPPLPPLPGLPWSRGGAGDGSLHIDLALIRELLPAAFAIAVLGSIESLLSAVIADAATGERHDPNAELIALGVGNVLCPFFGGIPATAALARTATNIRAGARSPVSSVVHAVFVLACTVALAPLVAYLPMAALAALLLVVAHNMSEAGHFVRLIRISPRSDVFVLVTCFALTVLFDMVIAVGAGVVMAALLFMRRMSVLTDVKLDVDTTRALDVPEGIQLYVIAGPLFFGAAERAMSTLAPTPSTRALVLDMSAVPVIDATGLVALESLLHKLDRVRCKVIFAGLSAPVRDVLDRAGIVRIQGRIAFAPDVETALSMAVVHHARG